MLARQTFIHTVIVFLKYIYKKIRIAVFEKRLIISILFKFADSSNQITLYKNIAAKTSSAQNW